MNTSTEPSERQALAAIQEEALKLLAMLSFVRRRKHQPTTMKRASTLFAVLFSLHGPAALAQSTPKPQEARKIMQNLDKAFGAQVDARELAEREYRMCTFDVAEKLLPNKVDSSPLLAQVASSECGSHLAMILSFETERRGQTAGKLAAEGARDSLVQEVAFYLAKKRAGYKP